MKKPNASEARAKSVDVASVSIEVGQRNASASLTSKHRATGGIRSHKVCDLTRERRRSSTLGRRGNNKPEFRYHPPGAYEQARTADHPQNGRARHSPRLEREGKFAAKSSGWFKTGSSSMATSSRSQSRRPPGTHARSHGPATGGRTAPMLFSGRLKRRFNSRDAVTETALRP